MGRCSNCDPVVTAASSQAAGGPCGEQGRSLSRQVCKSHAHGEGKSCPRDQSSCSPSLTLRQDFHHVAQAVL